VQHRQGFHNFFTCFGVVVKVFKTLKRFSYANINASSHVAKSSSHDEGFAEWFIHANASFRDRVGGLN
jgi:hypothetical protein